MTFMKSAADHKKVCSLDRPLLEAHQLRRLNALLQVVLPQNQFYAEKLAALTLPIGEFSEFSAVPFTTKAEIVGEKASGWAAHRTYPREHYTRFHQTSGTSSRPLILLDTPEDWQWWLDTWQYVLDAAEIATGDCCMLAFSFGPFIGFWSAFDALVDRGCLVIPGGGLSSLARLEQIETAEARCLFCTPSYALRLSEVAAEQGRDLRCSPIETIVVAGEPGGSIPTVRQQIETHWDAQVLDHAGASEVGPWGFGKLTESGLYINEGEFIAEFIDPESTDPVAEGALGELVLTPLGRAGHPLMRYRTGDLVRYRRPLPEDAIQFVFLEEGILGRADEMVIVRGINVLPSSIEQIIRGFEVPEFRLFVDRQGTMDELTVEVEADAALAAQIAKQLQVHLGLRIDVKTVPPKTLPRFEGKAKRFLDRRGNQI